MNYNSKIEFNQFINLRFRNLPALFVSSIIIDNHRYYRFDNTIISILNIKIFKNIKNRVLKSINSPNYMKKMKFLYALIFFFIHKPDSSAHIMCTCINLIWKNCCLIKNAISGYEETHTIIASYLIVVQ